MTAQLHPDVAATARVLARIRLELAPRYDERPVPTGRVAELREADRGLIITANVRG